MHNNWITGKEEIENIEKFYCNVIINEMSYHFFLYVKDYVLSRSYNSNWASKIDVSDKMPLRNFCTNQSEEFVSNWLIAAGECTLGEVWM